MDAAGRGHSGMDPPHEADCVTRFTDPASLSSRYRSPVSQSTAHRPHSRGDSCQNYSPCSNVREKAMLHVQEQPLALSAFSLLARVELAWQLDELQLMPRSRSHNFIPVSSYSIDTA